MGETIGQVIENCLLDWGIDKLLTITVKIMQALIVLLFHI